MLLDDFTLVEVADKTEAETHAGDWVRDTGFQGQKLGDIASPWYFANMGGTGISGKIVDSGEQRFVTLAMNKATSNFESAQLWQHLDLREGVRYDVSCRMRWDSLPGSASYRSAPWTPRVGSGGGARSQID